MDSKIQEFKSGMLAIIKWIILGLLLGIVIGSVGAVFSILLKEVTEVRENHKWIIAFLPLAGVLIIFLYRICGVKEDEGTNRILRAVSSTTIVRKRRAPLIFIATIITHLFGGSAGREGAALQLGGSLANTISSIFKFNESDKRILILTGMASCFSALFGTPLAASVFSMAVVSIGTMYYTAFLPCIIGSFTATLVTKYWFSLSPEKFILTDIPSFTAITGLEALGLAVICAALSILFALGIKYSHIFFEYLSPNPYFRAALGGGLVCLLTAIFGYGYAGAGTNIIEESILGDADTLAFLIKFIFTIITIGVGFKGGEIVPALAIGAAFGYFFSKITGWNLSLCVAVGMISLFCGITNCPIASVLLGLELFNTFDILPFIAIASAIAYVVSGNIGIYEGQKLDFSKYSLADRG